MRLGNSLRFLICVMALVSLVGCDAVDKLGKPDAKEVLQKYLDAYMTGQSEEAYQYISGADRQSKSLEEYRTERNDEALATLFLSSSSYKIIDIKEKDKKASATVEITAPNVAKMVFGMMGEAFSGSLSKASDEKMEEKLKEKYASGDIPMIKTTQNLKIVKDNGDWKVFLEWALLAKVKERLERAEQLEESNKTTEAVAVYESIANENPETSQVKDLVEKAKDKAEELQEKAGYVDKIVLYDLQAKYYKTYLDGKVPGVTFKLNNNGDRILSKVEVTVYFKDAAGNTIAEEDYHPVLVTKYSFGGDNKPLKPNYIWQNESGKFMSARSVPSEWKEGSITADITDIEFAD